MKRRATAIFVLLVGGLLLGRLFMRSPVEVTVVYQLGAAAQGVRHIEVRYLHNGDEARHVTWNFTADPPAEVEHHTRLAPGDYSLQIALTDQNGQKSTRDRPLHLEASGRAFVDLQPGR